MSRFTSVDNPCRQGRARMAEIATEDGEEIARITRQLIDSLDREPLPVETIAAEAIATSTVKAARARQRGRDDTRQREILVGLLQAAGVFGLMPLPAVQRQRQRLATMRAPFPPAAADVPVNAPVNAMVNAPVNCE